MSVGSFPAPQFPAILPPTAIVHSARRPRRGSAAIPRLLTPPVTATGPFTHVNGATGTYTATAASLSYTTTWTVAAGDLVLVGVAAYGSGTLTFTCSDGLNAYVQDVVKSNGNNSYAMIFRSVITTGGNLEIVITPSASCILSMGVDEYTFPADYLCALDGTTGNGSGTSGSLATGNLAPTTTGLVYGVGTGQQNNLGTLSVGSGFTSRYNYSPSSFAATPILCEDIAANTSTSLAVTETASPGSHWAIVGAAYMATPIPPLRQTSTVSRPPVRPRRGSALIASQTTKTSVAVPYIHLFGGTNAGLDL